MTWKQKIVRLFQHFGYDLRRYRANAHSGARRNKQMEAFGTDLVLDVGANAGQFAEELRLSGFRGRIVSFEPLKDAYSTLQRTSTSDPIWQAFNIALGSTTGKSTIHVAGNSYSSSLLEMLPTHESAAPESKYIREEEITVKTLDEMLPELISSSKSIWLKIDTQGFEYEVIKGAEKSLPLINTIQMEISLTPLYDGAPDFQDMVSLMRNKGYSIIDVEQEFCDDMTGRVLQMNLTFHRD